MLDAIVIGAGISGIAAARTLQNAELVNATATSSGDSSGGRVIVLEAKDRLGGRLWSESIPLTTAFSNEDKSSGTSSGDGKRVIIDWGGASLHGSKCPLGDYLLQEPGIATVPWGTSVYPAQHTAEWWYFQEAQSNSESTESSQSEPQSHDIPVFKEADMMIVHNSTKDWRHQLSDCLDQQGQYDAAWDYCWEHTKEKTLTSLASSLQGNNGKRNSEEALKLAEAWIQLHLYMENELDRGMSLHEMTHEGLLTDWDYTEFLGIDLGVGLGWQSIAKRLAEGLDVRLGQRVVNIEYSSTGNSSQRYCEVTTAEPNSSIYRAKACIVTLPLGVLKRDQDFQDSQEEKDDSPPGNTLFHPSLPAYKQEALRRSGVTAFNTMVVQWKKPVCRLPAIYFLDPPKTGQTLWPATIDRNNPLQHGFVCVEWLRNPRAPINAEDSTQTHNEASPITQFYVPGTINTRSGEDLPFHNSTYWKEQALQVVSLYHENYHQSQGVSASEEHHTLTVDDILDIRITDWHLDPDILGSYSAPVVGSRGNSDRQALQQPVDQVLYFAGEHTDSNGRYQTIDGAYESGILAAKQVQRDWGEDKIVADDECAAPEVEAS